MCYEKSDMKTLKDEIGDLVTQKCIKGNCYNTHVINMSMVMSAIKSLKTDKSDGNVTKMSNYIIHSPPLLSVHLALLFNSFMIHGFPPDEMLKGTIIPIPKNKRKSVNVSSNYRGIALSSIFGKLIDNIILMVNAQILRSCDLQFGFKPNHSTTQCTTFVLKEVVQYYMNQGGNVYCLLLDASKAFDNVHYVKLFQLLIKKGLCPLTARFLINLYTSQKLNVRWGNCDSFNFHVSNGVKQGGVLSPILFCVYLDELLLRLKCSGLGCHIGNVSVPAVSYADDISLMAPTVSSLKCMLNIIKDFGQEYCVKVNPDKSKLLVFGKVCNCRININFDGYSISQTDFADHLGHIIGANSRTKSLDKICSDIVLRINFLLSNFSSCNYLVKYKLVKLYCMALYGGMLLDLTNKDIDRLYVTWRKCIRKLIGIHYRTHSQYLPVICNDIPIENQIHKRYIKFVRGIVRSENEVVSLCGKLSMKGSQSAVSKSIIFLMSKYGISENEICGEDFIYKRLTNLPELCDNDIINIENIRSLLALRDDIENLEKTTMFTKQDIDIMLEYFCVT